MIEVSAWVWGVLAVLLGWSGVFSSVETALFSLTEEQQEEASGSVRHLLAEPRRLLVSVLFANLIVNVSYFTVAGRLLPGDSGVGDLTVGLGVLVALLIFGEILPKTLALRAPITVARLFAAPLKLVVLFLGPVGAPLVRMLEGFHRLLASWLRDEKGFSADVLASVMARGAEEGELLGMEADLVREVIELGSIRVREIMTPRVDALFLDISGDDRERVVAEALSRRQSWLPVIEGDADHVVGRVRVRELLQKTERPVARMVMPVKFVPEVASALDLLRAMRQDRTAEAVVVDEWGGTAGFVTAEDVFEEIVGDIRAEGEVRVPVVVPLGENRYRVAGSLSIRDWNEAFGLNVVPTEFETVGGFVTALLGRIPRAGDEARLENLLMTVHEVRGRRVLTVDIGVEAIPVGVPA